MNIIEPQQWVAKYYPYLQKLALSKISDPEQARDLVQDTFLAGLESLDHFKGTSTERTWLTGILLHKITDVYRRQILHQTKRPYLIAEQISQQACFSNEDAFIHKEFVAVVKVNLSKMPRLWADVFKLKYLDDVSTELICSKLGITVSNLWTITHRSKLKLRNYLLKAS